MGERVSTLAISERDVVVVSTSAKLPLDRIEQIAQGLKLAFPSTKILVCDRDTAVTVITGLHELVGEMEAEGGSIAGYATRLGEILHARVRA